MPIAENRLVIPLSGDIDHHQAAQLRRDIDAVLFAQRPDVLELDFQKVSFMDSSGIGLIMGRYALMKKMGGDFCVSNPNDRIMKIFELAGLGRIIRIESGKEED